ncbi:MAG: alpha/beta hydrolase family protein [Phycisphaerales bacterium]
MPGRIVAAVAAALAFALTHGAHAEALEVTYPAADGVVVFADFYEADAGPDAPLILLFHQGGSNARGEYADFIAPRLVEAGFHVLAPDARAGGDVYGGANRTATAFAGAREDGYCWAYPDLVASLEWAMEQDCAGPIIAWGSSYSAALALRLGAEHSPDLAGVLAFSPATGGPMGECSALRFIGEVERPVFLALPQHEFEMEQKQPLLAAAHDSEIAVHVQPQGVHGASMLHPDRAAGATDAMWREVDAFLAGCVERAHTPQ